ncbi:hypothetical protein Rs2_05040 [Raphanus sativus]|nr:hypothetical protein Rs2_05040 [Raphanus sativus]
MTCSRSVLEDIFNEHEMMVLHRVDLEMDLADRLQEEADRRYEAIAREVILVEDDDDENMAGAQTGGENDPVAITDPKQLPLTQPSTDTAEPQADIGALPLTQLAPALPEITQTEGRIFRRSTMETAMDFWEGLMGEDLVLPDGVEPDRAVVEGEGREEETIRLVDDGLVGAAQKEDDSSSTGSCVGLVVEVTPPVSVPRELNQAVITILAASPEPANELLAAFEKFLASNRGSSSQVHAPVVASGSGISVGEKTQDQTTVVVTTELGLTIDRGGVADPGPQDVATKKPNSSSDESGDDGYVGSGDKDLFVGKTFENRDAFKHHMALYAIKNKFVYRCAKSSPSVMVLECVGLTCTWRVYAVLVKGSNMYEVRKIGGEHCCSVDERAGYQRQATSSVIGGLLRQQFSGTGAGPRPGDIRQVMRGDHAVNISYWKAWRSRELAVDIAKGSCGASYKSLPNYLQRLVEANPGTITQLHTEYVEELGYRFKYMFVALGACVKGFQYMRKVVVVDGTHLRGKYAGCLLTASAQDGNYQIFPLAFAIVDGENDKSWEWFFHKLSSIVPDNDSVVFVSDRHASIYQGLSKVYPLAGHCACIIHLKRNIKTLFKERQLGYLVSKAARAFRMGEEYPVITLVEFIRKKLVSWFTSRRDAVKDVDAGLTPKVNSLLAASFEICGGYDVRKLDNDEYEVQDLRGASFVVSLTDRSCSCFEFQKLSIPCSHAIAAALKANVRVEGLVGDVYTIGYLKAAYAEHVSPPVELNTSNQLADDIAAISLHPPVTRRPPGRPRKKRFFSRGEVKMKKTLRYCSRCKGIGHNRATCKQAI